MNRYIVVLVGGALFKDAESPDIAASTRARHIANSPANDCLIGQEMLVIGQPNDIIPSVDYFTLVKVADGYDVVRSRRVGVRN